MKKEKNTLTINYLKSECTLLEVTGTESEIKFETLEEKRKIRRRDEGSETDAY